MPWSRVSPPKTAKTRGSAHILGKWQRRTRRTWVRGTYSETAQMVTLLILRTTVVGTALLFWWQGRATPGDVTYVLTAYFVVHGYLRDLGHHIANLQRCVNDMEEMVASTLNRWVSPTGRTRGRFGSPPAGSVSRVLPSTMPAMPRRYTIG